MHAREHVQAGRKKLHASGSDRQLAGVTLARLAGNSDDVASLEDSVDVIEGLSRVGIVGSVSENLWWRRDVIVDGKDGKRLT